MPAKMTAIAPEIYQLKVTLLGTSPPIWRRLLVPANITLAQLHDVLQTAMGWEDGHMHEFSLASGASGGPTLKTGSWECLLRKASAQCGSPGSWAGSAPKRFTRTILAIAGSILLSWRSGSPLIRTPRIRSARMVSLHVHRKIVEASPDSMIW